MHISVSGGSGRAVGGVDSENPMSGGGRERVVLDLPRAILEATCLRRYSAVETCLQSCISLLYTRAGHGTAGVMVAPWMAL